MAEYHVPVLLTRVIEYLRPDSGGLYFDGTVGGGGHSEAILTASEETRLIGVDQDPEAISAAARRLAQYGERVRLVQGNFADVAERMNEPLAGALLDLGVSSHQIDEAARGFTFRPGTPLDMRMDRPATGSSVTEYGSRIVDRSVGSGGNPPFGPRSSVRRTAAELLNELSEEELADLFYHYGEERRSRRVAAEIVKARRSAPLRSSDDLLAVLQRALGSRLEAQDKARLFQALRIAVNEELAVLDRALPALRDRLIDHGVLVVLSYHSLEDRRVKEAFREWSRSCICPPGLPICQCRGRALGETLTRKAVKASDDEVAVNPRARSVRLRAWSKVA